MTGAMASASPGAARAQSAWERLADERPGAALALRELFTALLADAQHGGGTASASSAMPATAEADAGDDAVLPFGGELLPGGLPDLAAALGLGGIADALFQPEHALARSAAGSVPGAISGSMPGFMPGSAQAGALAELLAAGPQGQGEAAYQSWARDVLHRVETLMRGADGGALTLPPADLEALALRLEQAAAGAGVPGQATAATAAFAAMLRGAGESGAHAEAVTTFIDATGAEPAPAAAAPTMAAQTHPLQAGAGERAMPAWSLNAPLHHAQWGEEIGERVRWMIGQQLQMAELKITPPQLGTIEVRISMHKDQMSISFAAPSAAVREALEEAMPRLREMLSGSGYETVNVDVSQHSLSQRRDTTPGSYAGAVGSGADEGDEAAVVGVTALRTAGASGVIDIYA